MQMNASSIVNQKAEWEKLGVKLPAFNHAAMTAATKEHPIWVHFGAGNIFRGFIAALQQRLLNEGLADRGIMRPTPSTTTSSTRSTPRMTI